MGLEMSLRIILKSLELDGHLRLPITCKLLNYALHILFDITTIILWRFWTTRFRNGFDETNMPIEDETFGHHKASPTVTSGILERVLAHWS